MLHRKRLEYFTSSNISLLHYEYFELWVLQTSFCKIFIVQIRLEVHDNAYINEIFELFSMNAFYLYFLDPYALFSGKCCLLLLDIDPL